jgi:arylsulfatase A-like enzyme
MLQKLAITCLLLASAFHANAADRPNILWIIIDDMSANFSCYGEELIQTPHVDKLAETGTLFSQAFVTAPVCSTNRSAFITGMYQTSIGAHQHRSGRGTLKIHLPQGVRPRARSTSVATTRPVLRSKVPSSAA